MKEYNILYIDDEVANLNAFNSLFRREFNITTANSGQKGLEILKSQLIHLIITDQRMPNMTGIEFLKKVKQKWSNIKYILLTGYSDHEVIKEAINDVGIYWYMNKPLDEIKLEHIINQAKKASQTEMEKKIADRKIQMFLETAKDALITIDTDHIIQFINLASIKLFEYEEEELIGQNVSILLPSNITGLGQLINDFGSSSNQSHIMSSGQLIFGKSKSGKLIPIETNLSKMEIDGSMFFNAIIRDVTQKVEAKRLIEESEEKFSEVFNSMVDVFTRSDMEGNCIMVSPSIYNLIGYRQEEVLGKQLSDFYLNPKQRDEIVIQLQASESIENFEIDLVRKDGNTIIASTNAKMYYNNKGEPLGVEGIIRDITYLKKADESRTKSEAKYRGLVDNSIVGVFTTTIDGRFLFVNEAMVSMYNFDSIEQMLTDGSLARWSDPIQSEQMLVELKKHGSVTNFEAETITHTGRHIHVLFSVKLQANNIIGMVMDITDRKLAEEKLQISETNFIKAQEVAHVGSWSLDLLKNNLLWSDETYRIFGIPKGTYLSYETFLEALHPEDRDYVNKKWSAAMEGEPYDIEHRLLIDNEVKWVREKAELTFDDKENAIGGIGIVQDITERKLAVAKLHESEEKFRTLVTNTEELVFMIAKDGTFLLSEGKGLSKLGLKPGEVVGKSVFDIYKDFPAMLNKMRKAFNGESVIAEFKIGDNYFKNWYTPYSNQEGEIIGLLGLSINITEQKKAELQIQEYQKRLKNVANELIISEEKIRKQIAVDLHDHVGQLLASMRMQMARITDMEENPELTVRMKSISQGLLKSIQATRTAIFDLSPPQLNEIGLVAATHDWMKEQIEQKHLIKTVISSDSEDIKLEENTRFLLFRSIKELMINTVKHAKARQLKVAIRKKDNFLEIAVEDDGVGFDYNPDLLRLKSDSYGLFSIQERISDLGGFMEVDSVMDKGTLIKLTVPLSVKSL